MKWQILKIYPKNKLRTNLTCHSYISVIDEFLEAIISAKSSDKRKLKFTTGISLVLLPREHALYSGVSLLSPPDVPETSYSAFGKKQIFFPFFTILFALHMITM